MAKLGINVGYIVWQIIAFGILAFLMQRFLYKPILNMLDKRAEKIKQGLDDAERARQKLAESEKEYVRKIEQARREAIEIERRIVADAQKEHDAIIAKAKAEIEQMRTETRQQLLAEARQTAIDLAIDMSRKVLDETVTPNEKAQRRLIDQFLEELEEA